MRIIGILLLLLLILPIVEASAETSWTHEFEAGYITTNHSLSMTRFMLEHLGYGQTSNPLSPPLMCLLEKAVGLPHTSDKRHDPFIYVDSGQGSCGVWEDLLIVGWVMVKLLRTHQNGSIVWENQTGDNFRGITGQMALETDRVVVPTRTGLSTFCLANGIELSGRNGKHWLAKWRHSHRRGVRLW